MTDVVTDAARAGRIRVTPAGHPLSVWAPALRRLPAFRLPRNLTGQRAVVAAAHADDETLGAGGLLQALHRAGAGITVLIATDGAAAFSGLAPSRRAELARIRRHEAHSALAQLRVAVRDVRFLDLPDGRAGDHEDAIRDALAATGRACSWWIAPWRGDPHPDHQAVGRAAAAACPPPAHLIEYPIWMRHGLTPRDPRVPWNRLCQRRLSRGEYLRKQRAIAAHASQTTVWDDAFEPVLPGYVLSLFRGRAEPFFVTMPRLPFSAGTAR